MEKQNIIPAEPDSHNSPDADTRADQKSTIFRSVRHSIVGGTAVPLLLMLIGSIFVGEMLIMLLITELPPITQFHTALLDAILLVFTAFPILYFLIFRPLTVHITERIHAESALKNSLSLMEAILESIHNGILVVSHQGTVIKYNATFRKMWQIPDDILASGDDKTLLNCVLDQLVDPDGFTTKVIELYGKHEAESLDSIHLKDGRVFKRISKPMYLGGEPTGRVWSFLDITERINAEEALLKSEAHLQTLLQTLPDLIWLKDLNGVYLSCNFMFARLVGVREAEVVGKTDYDLFSHEEAEFFRENDRNAIAAGKPTSNEEWLTFADNDHTALFDVIKTPMYDSIGTFIGVLGIGHDITKRKQVEEALKDSEEKYSKAFHTSPYAITITSAKDGRFIEINDAFTTLTGFTREEALADSTIGLKLWAAIEDRNYVISTLLEGKEVAGKEFRFKAKSGEIGTGLFSAQIIHLNNESFILSSINDITYRNKAEKAIRESEEKYRYMFYNNPQPMWIYDLETNAFLEVNQAAVNHYGYSREEFLAMTLKDIRPTEDLSALQKAIEQAGSSNDSNKEWRHTKKNGEIIFVQISAHSVIYNGRDARHVLVHDITDRKHAEAEIKLKNEELLKANSEKDKFFSIIAHDLRSPFNGFLGLTQIMADQSSSLSMEEFQQMAVSMEKSASNLFRLLENLLHWARIQQGLIPFNPRVVQLLPIADESIAMVFDQAKIKGIEITRSIPNDLAVFADYNMLQTIIRNLVSNSVKFTTKGGKVMLSAKPDGDNSVVIAIKDTGIGMRKEIVEQLFRLDVQTGREGTEGEPSTGLGLLLCKEFIDKHGWKIWVESTEGKGSTFTFIIPVKNY
jgi:PAS domain S-box-containing protein